MSQFAVAHSYDVGIRQVDFHAGPAVGPAVARANPVRLPEDGRWSRRLVEPHRSPSEPASRIFVPRMGVEYSIRKPTANRSGAYSLQRYWYSAGGTSKGSPRRPRRRGAGSLARRVGRPWPSEQDCSRHDRVQLGTHDVLPVDALFSAATEMANIRDELDAPKQFWHGRPSRGGPGVFTVFRGQLANIRGHSFGWIARKWGIRPGRVG